MKMFHFRNDQLELEFTNHERRPEIEEFKEVITILQEGGCVFIDKGWLPDYDWFLFKYNDYEFYVLYDEFQFSGTVIRTDNLKLMHMLENIFIDAGIEWYVPDER